MTPVEFEQANKVFTPPQGLDSSQCSPINAFVGQAEGGSCDGILIVVTAWKPSEEEIDDLMNGQPVFLTFVGGLPPHTVSTQFERAIRPA
jgi:hypothetical protein